MKIEITAKNTVTVTRALAEALGWNYDEERRCGRWGFSIGNTWAKTRKELHVKIVKFIEITGTSFADWSVLESAKCRLGTNLFRIVEN